MKRIIALLTLAMFAGNTASAQINMGALQNSRNAPNAARHLPTFLGEGSKKYQVLILNPYAAVSSNFATVEEARRYIEADAITNEMAEHALSKFQQKDNYIRGSVDLALLNVAFNLNNGQGKKFASIGFGVNERVEASTFFNKELFGLLYKGNKQYAGQTVELAPRFNGIAFMEYYAAGAFDFVPGSASFSIRPAIRLSYLSGQASVEMPKNNSISLYTDPQGRYLDFGFDYEVNASVGMDSMTLTGTSFDFNSDNFFVGAGKGMGVDLGLRVTLDPSLSFNLGIMDIGQIKFTRSVTNMFNHSSYRYEGESLSFDKNESIDLDSVARLAKPIYTHEAYTMALPTKLMLTGCKGYGAAKADGEAYFKHLFTGMYLQGFSNYLSSTTTPYVAVGYTRNFNNMFNLGANLGAGGTVGFNFGLLASVNAGPFFFGINSNNIIPLIAPSSGRSADFGLQWGLAL